MENDQKVEKEESNPENQTNDQQIEIKANPPEAEQQVNDQMEIQQDQAALDKKVKEGDDVAEAEIEKVEGIAEQPNQEKEEPEPEKIEIEVDLEQLQEDAKQIPITNYFVNNPCNCLWLGYAILIIMSMMAGGAKYGEYSILSPRDLFDLSEKESIDYDILNMVNTYIILEEEENPVRSQLAGKMHITYSNIDVNNTYGLLNKTVLLMIKDLEERIRDHSGFSQNCLASNKDSQCRDDALSSPLDVLKLMNSKKDLEDMTQKEIDSLFKRAFKKSSVLEKVKDNFDRAFIENVTNRKPGSSRRQLQPPFGGGKTKKLDNTLFSEAINITGQHMMTTIYLGGPLEIDEFAYSNSSQDQKVQDEFRKEFVNAIRDITKQSDYSKEENFGAKVNFGSELISDDLFKQTSSRSEFSMILVLFCFFIYLWVRTGSKFLSFIATTVVMYSFAVSLCVTRGILQIDNLSILYIATLYYIQGIMAEPVLSFINTWKQTAEIHPEVFEGDKGKRMAYTVRMTSKMFLSTTLVIVLALLTQVLNPLKVIRAFAIHGGINILVTYALLMMFLPSACVAYDVYIVGGRKFKTCCKKNYDPSEEEHKPDKVQKRQQQKKVDLELAKPAENEKGEMKKEEEKAEVKEVKLGRIDNFYDTKVNKFIFWARKPCSCLYFLWFLSVMRKQYPAQTDLEIFVDPMGSSMFVETMLDTAFTYGKGNGTEVSLYWGISDLNTTKTAKQSWDSNFIGYPVWDRKFNPATRSAQRYLKEICNDLDKQEFVVNYTTRCWIKDFEDYVEKKLGKSFPVASESSFVSYLDKWSQSGIGAQYKAEKFFTIYDGKIPFVKVTARSPVYSDTSAFNKQIEYKKWQDFIQEEEISAPQEMKNGRQTCKAWPLIKTEKLYASQSRLSYTVAIFTAIAIFAYTTNNYYQVCFNLIFMWFVEFATTSSRQNRNSAMVISQSTVCLGIAAFYVHFLSESYMKSPYVERQHKMRQVYREQGGRLLKASQMFYLSGLFLAAGRFTFCRQIGGAICSSVINSLIAMMFFGSLQVLFGPQEGAGTIRKKKVANLQTQQAVVMKLDETFKNIGDQQSQISTMEDVSYHKLKSFRKDMQLMRQEMQEEKEEVKKLLDAILANTSN